VQTTFITSLKERLKLKDRMDLEKQDGVADFLNECEKIVHSSEKMILFGSAKCAEKVYQ